MTHGITRMTIGISHMTINNSHMPHEVSHVTTDISHMTTGISHMIVMLPVVASALIKGDQWRASGSKGTRTVFELRNYNNYKITSHP